MNHFHITDLHYGADRTEEQVRHLGRILRTTHEAKLRLDFPDLSFTVVFNDVPGLNLEEYELTFWQSDAP